MPGFYVSNFKNKITLNNHFNERCVAEEIENENFVIKRNTLNKFLNDKIFNTDIDSIVITEGVTLNRTELMKSYGCQDFNSTIKAMRLKHGNKFFNEFIGSFSGAFFDKTDQTWTFWTDQYGSNTLFYYHDEQHFVVASQIEYILNTLKVNSIALHLDTEAVYSMLTYGFMYDDRVYANEIKRLEAGSYITISGQQLTVDTYFKIDNNTYNLSGFSEDEIIDCLDEKFRAAVKLEFDKDLEYNYQHIADLSGGLDCRMTTWVAHDLGYKNIINLHYSQSNSYESLISKQIAHYLGHELKVHDLDQATFIFHPDEMVSMNSGLCLYTAITGGKELLDSLDFEHLGIEHTGMLGDIVIGTFVSDLKQQNPQLGALYSTLLIDKIDHTHVLSYPNIEIEKLYIRGFNGALNSLMIRRNYTESTSAFMNPDFMQFCFSIPVEMRLNHALYHKWILKKYPQAALFRNANNNALINENAFAVLMRKIRTKGWKKTLQLLGIKNYKYYGDMNPYAYWYHNNPKIKIFLDQYFNDNINTPLLTDSIRLDMTKLFNNSELEKIQVITALSAIKQYFE